MVLSNFPAPAGELIFNNSITVYSQNDLKYVVQQETVLKFD